MPPNDDNELTAAIGRFIRSLSRQRKKGSGIEQEGHPKMPSDEPPETDLAELRKFAIANKCPPAMAHDIIHDVLLKIAALPPDELAAIKNLKAYARTCIHNQLANHWKRYQNRQVPLTDDVQPSEAAWGSREVELPDLTDEQAEEILESFPEPHSEILILTFVYEWDPAQIARRLGMDEPAVREHLKSATDLFIIFRTHVPSPGIKAGIARMLKFKKRSHE